MPQLTSVTLRPPEAARGFPFDLPALASITTLAFDRPVTLFVGENGSGKSTLLEALAIASRAITAGSAEAADDPSLECAAPPTTGIADERARG
ncbi:MAG: AAA family ATPase [Chloroflexi bacterium]|nr:AAA family ATPase [Chloroflexota bacterium]